MVVVVVPPALYDGNEDYRTRRKSTARRVYGVELSRGQKHRLREASSFFCVLGSGTLPFKRATTKMPCGSYM